MYIDRKAWLWAAIGEFVVSIILSVIASAGIVEATTAGILVIMALGMQLVGWILLAIFVVGAIKEHISR
jgi:hypothetical protein